MLHRPMFFKLLVVGALVLTVSFVANAQATRTWVSGVGDDGNPCSRTAPCKTFAGAISKTAANGEINCLDSGGFGSVTITKSITIDCKGMTGGILAANTTGIIINSATAVVHIRGVNISGAGNGLNGIMISAAASVNVEDIVIDGFTKNGISTSNAGNGQVSIHNSAIRNNAGAGIYGFAEGSTDFVISKSLLSGNGIGVQAGPNSTMRITGNTIVHNLIGLSVLSNGKIISFKDNAIDGNGKNGAPTSVVSQQ